MEKQVATRTSAPPPSVISGAPKEVLSSDIKIPYVILGQGLSDAVIEKKVAVGDIFRSTSQEVLGNPESPIDVIFLHYPQTIWVIEKKPKGSDRWKYVRSEPRNASNETEPWTFFATDEGVDIDPKTGAMYQEGDKGVLPWRRVKQLRVFAILLHDILAANEEIKKADSGELPDPSKALTPVVFSFRSSSYDAGKEVCTFGTRAMSMKQPLWKYTVKMGCYLDKNDEGTFTVWKADTSKPKGCPRELLPLVEEWANMVNKRGGELQTDEAAVTAAGE